MVKNRKPLPHDLVNILRKQLRTDGPVFSATNLRKAFEYAAVEVGLGVWRDPGTRTTAVTTSWTRPDLHMAMDRVQDLVTSSLQAAVANSATP